MVAAAIGLAPKLISPVFAQQPVVVGYLYVGSRKDFGYNQNHALTAKAVAKLPGVKVVEQENVPENQESADAMEAMIRQENAKLIFATSFGYYDPHLINLAKRYPAVRFQHCGGVWKTGEHPDNIGTYFCRMHEGQYLAGITAGLAGSKLGFVASYRYPSILRNINAFMLGARSVNPAASMRVLFTGSWSDPVKEAEAVNIMADQGAQVVGCSVDAPRSIIHSASQRGVLACGYNASLHELGLDNYLTSAIADWSPINVPFVQALQFNDDLIRSYNGGVADGVVRLGEFGPAATSEMRELTDNAISEFKSAQLWIWSGPINDNNGKQILAAGDRLELNDIALRKMNWFVEGVQA